ncbi:MAG: hypothetical protein ACE5GX_09025 [Thermoanaerobaculia bacterium]
MKQKSLARLLVLAMATLPIASSALADSQGGSFELYGGLFAPEDEEETTYGLRAGYRKSESLGFELSLGEVDLPFEFELRLVDLSIQRFLSPGGESEWVVSVGGGWAFIDAGPLGNADSASAHLGLGWIANLSDSVYLRTEVRDRWFEDGGDTELEATLALGFVFGG